ncbi:sugar phosphate isomerase/epimerase [Caulobacter segnis]|uniref:Xylose isomerase domain protein TIM barrel n=2 Tax=Caulobacter segnis TaxID=88688 RepID=D5VJP8_CAUST|nr:sugar phosphate isomerase/epimerase [Caulobacter segnis]ADG10577.1 Xylose isomerase domain protein TIM barrel [Caulobacter segnis ATCC 21756]AVQ02293.1 sugar phosphate isomerase/epimerase [Caulobacter segnis]
MRTTANLTRAAADLSRRGFLAAGVATFAAAGAASAAQATFFQRHKLPLGIQLYSLGPDLAKELDTQLATVSKIGFKTVELAGYLGRTPAELRAAFDRAGLACTSAHVQPKGAGASFSGDLAKLADDLHVIGVKTAIMPIHYIPDRFTGADLRQAGTQMTAEDWKWNADFLNEKAAVLKKAGIATGYHNHNFELAPLGDTTGMDILLKGTDPSLVTFEMDAGWVTAAGHDPFAMLKAHPGRFTHMHVKDVKPTTKANFELRQDPTEVGSGMINWPKLLPAAYDAGVRGFFYEQEPPFKGARLESAKISFGYLAKVVA